MKKMGGGRSNQKNYSDSLNFMTDSLNFMTDRCSLYIYAHVVSSVLDGWGMKAPAEPSWEKDPAEPGI